MNTQKKQLELFFFDLEFTGLHQKTTPISIGIQTSSGPSFYAEFTDYDKDQINDWLRENVISGLKLRDKEVGSFTTEDNIRCVKGDRELIKKEFLDWLEKFSDKSIEVWGDCLAYDWVLFNELFADYSNGYPSLPSNINYIPFDLCTLFKTNLIDPDINRETFVGIKVPESEKHNSLFDATVIKWCFQKILQLQVSAHTREIITNPTAKRTDELKTSSGIIIGRK